ncbi:MAG: response regulator [Gaiellaceae bacterium]
MNAPPIEILLVEDNPNDLELAMHAFRKHNLANRVEVARDGQEALDYLLGSDGRQPAPQPKLILLDLKLPRVDGLEVLRRVRAEPSLRFAPVVVLTTSREDRDLVESYSLGVNSYIVKPIDFDKFVETVQALGFYWLLINEAPSGA